MSPLEYGAWSWQSCHQMETSHLVFSWQTNCKSANQSGPFRQSFEPNLTTDVLLVRNDCKLQKTAAYLFRYCCCCQCFHTRFTLSSLHIMSRVDINILTRRSSMLSSGVGACLLLSRLFGTARIKIYGNKNLQSTYFYSHWCNIYRVVPLNPATITHQRIYFLFCRPLPLEQLRCGGRERGRGTVSPWHS